MAIGNHNAFGKIQRRITEDRRLAEDRTAIKCSSPALTNECSQRAFLPGMGQYCSDSDDENSEDINEEVSPTPISAGVALSVSRPQLILPICLGLPSDGDEYISQLLSSTQHLMPSANTTNSWSSPISSGIALAMSRPQLPLRAAWDADEFGLAHPQILMINKKKYEWSNAELNWLADWFNVPGNADIENRYSECLNAIRINSSPETKQIFHPHHILNSARLRAGALNVEYLLGFKIKKK